jgi:SAM-dependent methyltransferase
MLLDRGSRVYCVEPNDDMRRIAEADLAGFLKFTSINAPAENTGLQAVSADFITAAQAFHWFDRQAFKTECRRILKPGGKVVLVWNKRDNGHDLVKKDYAIREKYCVDMKGLGDGGGSPPREYFTGFFAGGNYDEKLFRNDLMLDREGFIGRNLSASYAPREETDPEKYHGLVKELGLLFDKNSVNGILHYPHFTECYIGGV